MYAQNSGQGAGAASGEFDEVLSPAAVEAARYICQRKPGVPKTSLVKLLYLADREYADRHGHTLLGTKWWREEQGPLSSAVTRMIRGPEFQLDETTSPSGNLRLGHTDVGRTPLIHLGTAEISVIDTVLAEFGNLGQVELLQRVHALPEVTGVPIKAEIEIPRSRPRDDADYLVGLLTEIERESAAGIHDSITVQEDDDDREEGRRQAIVTFRAAID